MSANQQLGINVLCEHVAVKNSAWYHSYSFSCCPAKHEVKKWQHGVGQRGRNLTDRFQKECFPFMFSISDFKVKAAFAEGTWTK